LFKQNISIGITVLGLMYRDLPEHLVVTDSLGLS
jgi:hypothetical protein